ncbi:MAG: hypothetical protein P8182_17450 [Deltaproteobacteria bacterium]
MHMRSFEKKVTRLEFAGFVGRVLMAFSLVTISSRVPAAFGLWLPWAKEEDKISKKLNDIWSALVNKDQRALKQYLSGNGAQAFIDQEEQVIKTFKIKGYQCTVKRVQFDPSTKKWAFVEFERIGSTEDGKEKKDRLLRVMKKVGNQWKLLTDVKRRGVEGVRVERKQGTVGADKNKSQSAGYLR